MYPLLLTLIPLLISLVLLQVRDNIIRKLIVKTAAVVIGGLSITTAFTYINQPVALIGDIPGLPIIVMGVDFLTAVAILYYTVKYKH